MKDKIEIRCKGKVHRKDQEKECAAFALSYSRITGEICTTCRRCGQRIYVKLNNLVTVDAYQVEHPKGDEFQIQKGNS